MLSLALLLGVGLLSRTVPTVLSHPVWWPRCEHPKHKHGKHKQPQHTEDLQFTLVDIGTQQISSVWTPGKQYHVNISAPVAFQAFATITGGVLDHSGTGFDKAKDCQRVALPPVPEDSVAATYTLDWTAPECCSVKPETFVQIYATAATGKHTHFMQGSTHLDADTSSCKCSDLASAGIQHPSKLPNGPVVMMTNADGSRPPKALPSQPSSADQDSSSESPHPSSQAGSSGKQSRSQKEIEPQNTEAASPAGTSPGSDQTSQGTSGNTVESQQVPHEQASSSATSPPSSSNVDKAADPHARGFDAETGAKHEGESGSSSASALFIAIAAICLLLAAAGVVTVVLRRRRLRRQGYADFGSLEMRDYAQWQQDAGL